MPLDMAALREASLPEVVHLRQITVQAIHPLLEEETAEWRDRLRWDFRTSAELVRRYVGLRSLAGFALLEGGRVSGYTYLVAERRKGLIGDLYLRSFHEHPEYQNLLLEASVRELFEELGAWRIEAQLMMLRAKPDWEYPFASQLRVYPRLFMSIDAGRIQALAPGRAARSALIMEWRAEQAEEVAGLIAEAYRGHVDSEINDQYQTASGARRFLTNIMQHSGCGVFFPSASFVALDAWSGRVMGVSLASLLAQGSGHITQICVAPPVRRRGLGYELLRRSLTALAEAGCNSASLTVTAANTQAVDLYRRVGFELVVRFPALVWERR